MANEYRIGECPHCRQGFLIVCTDPATSNLYACCDDCESLWDNPEAALRGDDPVSDIQELRDAAWSEIESTEWEAFVENAPA